MVARVKSQIGSSEQSIKLRYPDFEFNRFGPYLVRGCWSFLVQLVANFALVIPIAILWGIGTAITVVAHAAGAVAVVVWILAAVAMLLISLAVSLLVWPMMIHAGVSQGLDIVGMFGFATNFVRKVLVELIITLIFGFICGNAAGNCGTHLLPCRRLPICRGIAADVPSFIGAVVRDLSRTRWYADPDAAIACLKFGQQRSPPAHDSCLP